MKFVAESNRKRGIQIPKFITETDQKSTFENNDIIKIVLISKDQKNLLDELKNIFSKKVFRINEIANEGNIYIGVYKENLTDKTSQKEIF